jgi:hypothetical protein
MTGHVHSKILIVIKDALLYKARRVNATELRHNAADGRADKIKWHKKTGPNRAGEKQRE